MDDIVAAEARGDASNLKGTDYHLLYALWLLIVDKSACVHFFEGNDLLARPAPPPTADDAGVLSASIAAHSTEDKDTWIQLKCTTKAWTCSELLGGNLLQNFICNSFLSENRGRSWLARLITTSEIRQAEILGFVEDISGKPTLKAKLDQIVGSSTDAIAGAWPEKTITRAEVYERSLTVLRQIVECDSLPRRVLDAELSKELAFRCPDRDLADGTRKKLLGSLLEDTARGVEHARGYDLDWVESETGLRFFRIGTLDKSVAEACDEQVAKRLPSNFVPDMYTTRAASRLLEDFIHSDVPLFVLSGRSGTGKSWLIASWAQAASGRARIIIPGHVLTESTSLISLVANEFLSTETAALGDRAVFERVVRASSSKGFGPLVVIFDDVRPLHGRSQEFARRLGTIVEQARTFGIKLVMACQADVVRSFRPFVRLNGTDVFHVDPRAATEDSNLPSCVLDDFTSDELRDSISKRVDPEKADRVAAHLLAPNAVAVRNPYLLDTLLDQRSTGDDDILARVANCDMGYLLERRLGSLLDAASAVCSLNPTELRRILAALIASLRDTDSRLTVSEAYREIEQEFVSIGKEAIDAFVACGIVTRDEVVSISDTRIAAWLTSVRLAAEYTDVHELVEQLDADTDFDVVVHLICLTKHPVELANTLADSDAKWLPAAADGLALCNGPEEAVEASLVGFSRREPESKSVVSALGRYALRSRYAWKQLVRRFVSTNDGEQRIAEHALWHVASMTPDATAKAIRLRFRLTKGPDNPFTNRDKKNRHRLRLARALRPMRSIDSRYAATRILSLLDDVKAICEAPLQSGSDEAKLQVVLTDPLVQEFSELELLATAFADESAFNASLKAATVTDIVSRAKVVTALDVAAFRFPQRVMETFCESIRTETDPALLARLTWAAANIARREPGRVLEAIEANAATCWESYESTAATLSLLELVASDLPLRVLELLPVGETTLPDEVYWVVRELFSLCRYKCRNCIGGADTTPSVLHVEPLRIGHLPAFSLLYVERAAIVDALLGMAIDLGWNDGPLIWRTTVRDRGPDFFKVGMSGWIATHQQAIAGHHGASQLQDKIVAAAAAGREHSAHPLDGWSGDVRFWLVLDCLDVLITLLISNPTPEGVVANLPSDWEQLYVARRLFEHGCVSSGLVDFAISACEEKSKSATAQGSSERTECLIALQRIVPDRVPEPRDEQHGLSLFGGHGVGVRLIAQLDEDPRELVTQLEDALHTPTDGMLLESWHTLAKKWPTIMASRAYSRMFRHRRMAVDEAISLCESMLIGLDVANDSAASREHKGVYQAILNRLQDREWSALDFRSGSRPLHESHRFAVHLLAVPSSDVTIRVLRDELHKKLGWWEREDRRWSEDGSLHGGTGSGINHHILIFQPAVRLAFFAVGQDCDWSDPAFDWTVERHKGTLVCKDVSYHIRNNISPKSQLAKIEDAVHRYPEHEGVREVYGHALLVNGQPEAAQQSLQLALSMPLCVGPVRADALYNLACAFARQGAERNCRRCLREQAEIKPIDLAWLAKDPDFESVRDSSWFKQFVRLETRRQQGRGGWLVSLMSKAKRLWRR